ncbi:hypothetical protein LY76DRAFT_351846 [Colletotrichum caudatum]|nr:hypothetical protein LY76DRAFT_351846 [Colletotrichum caudatum]
MDVRCQVICYVVLRSSRYLSLGKEGTNKVRQGRYVSIRYLPSLRLLLLRYLGRGIKHKTKQLLLDWRGWRRRHGARGHSFFSSFLFLLLRPCTAPSQAQPSPGSLPDRPGSLNSINCECLPSRTSPSTLYAARLFAPAPLSHSSGTIRLACHHSWGRSSCQYYSCHRHMT